MTSKSEIRNTLKALQSGRISSAQAFHRLKDLPYLDLGFAKLDCHRGIRRGFPEVIFGDGKSAEQIKQIVKKTLETDGRILITKVKPQLGREIIAAYPALKYDELARMVYTVSNRRKNRGFILVVTAGTSDIPIAQEARAVCEIMGNRVACLYDVGVAGIHRLLDHRPLIKRAKVIIVVAGMEGALASVISGLVGVPVVAVPTSVGYGASFRGIAPLLTMMNSCSPGIAVVNIDNGFGAGYFASLVNK